jgi:hypothetical protein
MNDGSRAAICLHPISIKWVPVCGQEARSITCRPSPALRFHANASLRPKTMAQLSSDAYGSGSQGKNSGSPHENDPRPRECNEPGIAWAADANADPLAIIARSVRDGHFDSAWEYFHLLFLCRRGAAGERCGLAVVDVASRWSRRCQMLVPLDASNGPRSSKCFDAKNRPA